MDFASAVLQAGHPRKTKEPIPQGFSQEYISRLVKRPRCESPNWVWGAKPDGAELLIATNKDWKQRKAMREAPASRGRIPAAMTARERRERKLLTKRGRVLYKLRGRTIEPAFGQIKNGMDGFLRRGVKAADSEWSLMCATHNLLKLWRSGKAKIGRIFGEMAAGTPIIASVYA